MSFQGNEVPIQSRNPIQILRTRSGPVLYDGVCGEEQSQKSNPGGGDGVVPVKKNPFEAGPLRG